MCTLCRILFTDRLFFEYGLSDSTFYNIQLFLIKGSFFFALWAMYAWIFSILDGIRSGTVPKEKVQYFSGMLIAKSGHPSSGMTRNVGGYEHTGTGKIYAVENMAPCCVLVC